MAKSAPDSPPGLVVVSSEAAQDHKSADLAPNSTKKTAERGSGRTLIRQMQKLSSWLSTAEPASHALKQHKEASFRRAGVDFDDPDASTKLHAPLGEIPKDAIRPATGPSPEEAAMARAKERRKRSKRSVSASDGSSVSRMPSQSSSGVSTFSSAKGSVSFEPSINDFEFPFDGRSRKSSGI